MKSITIGNRLFPEVVDLSTNYDDPLRQAGLEVRRTEMIWLEYHGYYKKTGKHQWIFNPDSLKDKNIGWNIDFERGDLKHWPGVNDKEICEEHYSTREAFEEAMEWMYNKMLGS